MKSAIAAITIAAAGAAALEYPMFEGITYEDYLQEYRPMKDINALLANPKSLSEISERKAIFELNLKKIRDHNAQKGSWFMTVNQFADMTPTEIAKFYNGYAPETNPSNYLANPKSTRFQGGFVGIPPRQMGDHANINWVENGIVRSTKNQGSCGSCWAFAAAHTLEASLNIESVKQTGRLLPESFAVSTQQLTSCTPNERHCGGTGGCEGATAQLAFDYLKNAGGIVSEQVYPYTSGSTRKTGECDASLVNRTSKIGYVSGHTNLKPNDADELINALKKAPVAVSVAASRMSFYGGGVFDGCTANKDYIVNHAVTLVGTGVEKDANGKDVYYYLIQNSWGKTWGSKPDCSPISNNPVCNEKGFIKLRRAAPFEAEKCGMNTKPFDGAACEDEEDVPYEVCGECAVLSDSSLVHAHLNATTFF